MKPTQLFYMEMIAREFSESDKRGCFIHVPISEFGVPGQSQWKKVEKENSIKFCQSLIDLYQQVEHINIDWVLMEDPKKPSICVPIIQNDEWLKKNYFDNEYSWEFVKELLSGHLHIPNAEKLVGPAVDKKSGYYLIAKEIGIDPATICPFDFHERLTAVLKIENKEIIDHVYLMDLENRKLYDMKVDINTYLQLAYEAKLFNCWQLVFVLKKDTEHYELMKRFLPQIVSPSFLHLEKFGIK